MTPHKQRFLHRPEQGQHGDCSRTVLACLLDLEPEEVPHWHEDLTGAEQDRRHREWLAERGLTLLHFAWHGVDRDWVDGAMRHWNPGHHYLLCGQSPRGTYHVVICCDGEMVHDPHPEGGGVIGPDSEGWWRVEFIGKLI